MINHLYIAAKAPRPGVCKTRLGQMIGDSAAASLYAAFLADLGARLQSQHYLLGWYVAPSTAWPAIAPLVPPPDSILVQPEGEWGERQAHLFKTISAPSNKVVLIASDSPQIELETVLQSFAALTQSDLVLGPTYDGGYWLIGMRGSHDLLTGLQMSGPDVLNQLLARAERLKLDVTLLPATFDIDVEEDLVHLREVVEHRSDLMATRAALIRLGLLEGVKSR